MLNQFGKQVQSADGDLIRINELCESTAESLANLINAQTTAALVALHVGIKSEIGRVINDLIDQSGKEIIESFKSGQLKDKIDKIDKHI